MSQSSGQSFLTQEVLGRNASTKDIILFTRQIATMIRAGVPVLQALRMISRQTEKQKFRAIIENVIQDVEGGSSLSFAMSKHSRVFSPFFLGVLRSGEASGRLTHALDSLSYYYEQNYIFTRKVQAALTYPVLVLVTIIVVMLIIFAFIMPQLITLFADANVILPLPTVIVVSIAVFFQDYWYVVVSLFVVLGLLFRSYIKTPEGRYTVSTYVLRIPILKSLFSRIYLARLTSVMHTLFDSDVPVLESLRLARESVGNKVYQRILDDTITAVKDGVPISRVWEREIYIPPLLTALITVGERSGELAKAFQEAQRYFQREVDEVLNSITVLLEPLLIIMLGIGVFIIVAAVLLPIYNLVLVL